MAEEKKSSTDIGRPPSSDEGGAPPPMQGSLDEDALRLSEMGYTQDMRRNFSVLSVLGVGFSLTNSWFGIAVALVAGINSGGPLLFIYGVIILALLSVCVGISLSELASAYPNAGGQYFWASVLAPKGYSNFASYLTGWFAWAGSVFTSGSVALGLGGVVVGCYQLMHPDFEIQPWHVVVAYQVINLFAYLFNCYGRTLPTVAQIALYTSLLSFLVILITVPARAPTHESARFVFATFVNNTGWTNNGIAFIVGLIACNWPFACLDCATHLAEEVKRPERMVPIAIMGTVAIGFVTAWFFSISIFFSVQDLQAIVETPTLVPILELFLQALGNRGGAIALVALVVATGVGCLVAAHTWQCRLLWSFARDSGVPGGKYLSYVDPVLEVPVRAHSVSCALVGVLGLLYLGSSTAFNALVTACITLLYISYAIPVVCLLIRGRDNIPHGPFWLGTVGHVSNYVLLAYTAFTLVLYSLPTIMPAEASSMNYVSAVYAIVISIIAIDWFARGRKHYRGEEMRRQSMAAREQDTAAAKEQQDVVR